MSEDGGAIAYLPEVAGRKIGLGRTRIFEEIKAGRLPAKKLGRKTVILEKDLRAFAENLPPRQTGSRAPSRTAEAKPNQRKARRPAKRGR